MITASHRAKTSPASFATAAPASASLRPLAGERFQTSSGVVRLDQVQRHRLAHRAESDEAHGRGFRHGREVAAEGGTGHPRTRSPCLPGCRKRKGGGSKNARLGWAADL